MSGLIGQKALLCRNLECALTQCQPCHFGLSIKAKETKSYTKLFSVQSQLKLLNFWENRVPRLSAPTFHNERPCSSNGAQVHLRSGQGFSSGSSKSPIASSTSRKPPAQGIKNTVWQTNPRTWTAHICLPTPAKESHSLLSYQGDEGTPPLLSA
jgi:hypothetical protein